MKNVIRLALLLFVAFGVWTAATYVDTSAPADGLKVGDTAPDFS
jgi:hypothetical protein